MADPMLFFTWNLAMLSRSAEAPPAWSQEHTEFAVRQAVLDVEPDLVLFQELPRMVPYIDTHDMIKANPESHQGNLATLISHDVLARHGEPEVGVVANCAVLVTIDGLTVANVHLAPGPGPEAAAERLAQLADVVEASPTEALVIVGDTNTRVGELDALADAGLAAPRPPKPTWNTERNRFHPKGPEFTAYFTRVFATERVEVSDQRVLDAPVDIDGHRFHLSDHFALTGSITATRSAPAA